MKIIKKIPISEDVFKIGTELNETIINKAIDENINILETAYTNSINKGPYLLQTIFNDIEESKLILSDNEINKKNTNFGSICTRFQFIQCIC